MAGQLDEMCTHVVVADDMRDRVASIFDVIYDWRRRPKVSCGFSLFACPGGKVGQAHVSTSLPGVLIFSPLPTQVVWQSWVADSLEEKAPLSERNFMLHVPENVRAAHLSRR